MFDVTFKVEFQGVNIKAVEEHINVCVAVQVFLDCTPDMKVSKYL